MKLIREWIVFGVTLGEWMRGFITLKGGPVFSRGAFTRERNTLDSLFDMVRPIFWVSSVQKRSIWTTEDIQKIFYLALADPEIRMAIAKCGMKSAELHHFSDYTNYAIENSNTSGQRSHYAELWHIDSCFSSRTLKLFIFPDEVLASEGPTQVLRKKEVIHCTGKRFDWLIISPASFMHRAGVPNPGKSRRMICMTVIPGGNWAVHRDIALRQYNRELKYPMFRNLA